VIAQWVSADASWSALALGAANAAVGAALAIGLFKLTRPTSRSIRACHHASLPIRVERDSITANE
jgi:hypothetical protein